MKLKTKLRLALTFLFAVIVLLGSLGAWYLKKLSSEAQEILKDNYISLEYVRNMRNVIDENAWKNEDITLFEKSLLHQEQNITEIGEAEATQQLRSHFNALRKSPDSSRIRLIAQQLTKLTDVNMQAIVRKNAQVKKTADEVYSYMVLRTQQSGQGAFRKTPYRDHHQPNERRHCGIG